MSGIISHVYMFCISFCQASNLQHKQNNPTASVNCQQQFWKKIVNSNKFKKPVSAASEYSVIPYCPCRQEWNV